MSSAETPLPKPKSLCYRSSYIRKKDGTITEKEHFHNLFRHLTGVKHGGDDSEHQELKELDPVGYSINCWIVKHHNETVDDCTPFEDVFDIFRKGTVENLKSAIGNVPECYREDVRRSLALLALQERNVDVLKWLLDDGISYEEVFEEEVRRVMKGFDPETWNVLKDTAERKNRPWTKREQVKDPHPLW